MRTKPVDVPKELRGNPGRRNLRAEANAWIRKNPKVYGLFKKFSREIANTGRRFGVKLLTERVRWECFVRINSDDGFKMNNNHTSYIARRLLEEYPRLKALLVFRETKY